MASLAMMAGGALINALAFSGTNAAFSLLGDHGESERKRHDIAVERLSKEYHEVTGQQLPPLRDEPELSDFYNPSRQRKDAEIALVFGGMTFVIKQ